MISCETKEINNLIEQLNNDPRLKMILEEEIILLIERLTFSEHQSNEQAIVLEKILESYDAYLSDNSKLKVMLLLNDPKIFKKYVTKNYKELEQQMKNCVFFNRRYENDLDEIENFQYSLDIRYGIGQYNAHILESPFLRTNAYDFYNSFHHVIRLHYINEINNGENLIFQYLTFNQLLTILEDKILNNTNTKAVIDTIISQYFKELLESNILTDEKIANAFLPVILQNMSMNRTVALPTNEKLYYEIKRNLKNKNSTPKELNSIYSTNYLIAIDQLKELSEEKRQNSIIYLRCFQLFLKEILKNFTEEIDNEDIKTLEILFKRTINRDDLIIKDILKIDNRKTLHHFFKTNEIIYNIPLPLDKVKKYSAKQYLKLNEIPQNTQKKDDETEFIINSFKQIDKSKSITTLILLDHLGYDFLKQSRLLDHNISSQISNILNGNDPAYAELIKKLLLQDHTIFINKDYNSTLVMDIIEYLYEENHKKITPEVIKRTMYSCDYILVPNNKHIANNLEKLNLVHKGEPLLEKIKAIKLYNDYRYRIISSIPDINGKTQDYSYEMVDLHDTNIISNGIGEYILPNQVYASSCLTPNGKAASCLEHGAKNPHGRFFKITHNNKIMTYSWVWRSGEVLCFDNIEITKDFANFENYEQVIFEIYKKAANELITITKNSEERGIKLVILGRNKIDVANKYIDNLPKVNNYTTVLFSPTPSENLYLKDSEEIQLILEGEYKDNLNTENVEPIYLYPRKPVKKLEDSNEERFYAMLNSIYFDYCIENNQKYSSITDTYIDGYIAEDWFYGEKIDGSEVFYYRGKDDRLFEEVREHTKKELIKPTNVSIVKNKDEQLQYLSDPKNYIIQRTDLIEYLNSYKGQNFCFSADEFLHGTRELEVFGKILLEKEITSTHYGNRPHRYGTSNGQHYICVAKIGENIQPFVLPSFILDKNICAFTSPSPPLKNIPFEIAEEFRNSTYPFRITHGVEDWEYQVYQSISLDKAKAILIFEDDITRLSQIITIQEYTENNLPLVGMNKSQILEKDAIKQFIKLK